MTIANVSENTLENNITIGVEARGSQAIDIVTNTITNNGQFGVHASGANNVSLAMAGNNMTDNNVQARFESGEIDLTGDGNVFTGGAVGLQFAPIANPTLLTLVDNDGAGSDPFGTIPPTNFGGTIGAQTFSGQSTYFVDFQNGAFLSPGNPTLINGQDSTYITPTGPVTPSQTQGVVDIEAFEFINARVNDFIDDGSLGAFFFAIPPVNQNSLFNRFADAEFQLENLRVTVSGLPNIPGSTESLAASLANIAPFAGGDDQGGPSTPEQLNQIETAAGDSDSPEAACWGDVASVVGLGQAVNFDLSGDSEDLLSGAANCSGG